MRVEQIMNRDVKTCASNAPADRAARIMWESDIGAIPVTDASGRVISMVTDRDLCMACLTQSRALHEFPVSVAAVRKAITIGPNDTIQAAEDLMRQHQIRRLPVCERDGRIVGILSLNDLARQTSRRGEVSSDEVARTLEAISTSSRPSTTTQAQPS